MKRFTAFGLAACFAMMAGQAFAQAGSAADGRLETALTAAVVSRVENPIVFSTRDTLFALSLSTDEKPEIYLHITVGKNGKVKEKMTRVNANHIGANVAPAFVEATKELRIDRALLAGMSGRDTAVMVTIPLAYQCVLDTVSRAWPDASLKLQDLNNALVQNSPTYPSNMKIGPDFRPVTPEEIEKGNQLHVMVAYDWAESQYIKTTSSPLWLYMVFIDLPHSEQ